MTESALHVCLKLFLSPLRADKKRFGGEEPGWNGAKARGRQMTESVSKDDLHRD